MAYCAMTINAGSRDEESNELGIAHFAEHALFKGTKNKKASHINSCLERLGGELNAFTTKEETVIHTTTLLNDISKATDLITDVVFNSVFPETEIDKEREVILDEINSYKDLPSELIYDEFEDLLFEGSTLGHNILGTRKSVRSFKGDSIADFTTRCYNTDQMVFSVAANITEKKFMELIIRHLGHIPQSNRNYERSVLKSANPFNIAVDKDTYQAHCMIGSRAYSVYHPDRVALSLLINILGGPAANSDLNMLLREKNGLSYTVDAAYTPYCDTGVASIYFGTDKENADKCINLIYKLLDKTKQTKLSASKLEIAKKQLIGQLTISMESKESYMLNVGRSQLIYNEVDGIKEVYEKISQVTDSDIMRVANEVFGETSILIYK